MGTTLENQGPRAVILDPAAAKGMGWPKGPKEKNGGLPGTSNLLKKSYIILILDFLTI